MSLFLHYKGNLENLNQYQEHLPYISNICSLFTPFNCITSDIFTRIYSLIFFIILNLFILIFFLSFIKMLLNTSLSAYTYFIGALQTFQGYPKLPDLFWKLLLWTFPLNQSEGLNNNSQFPQKSSRKENWGRTVQDFLAPTPYEVRYQNIILKAVWWADHWYGFFLVINFLLTSWK